MAPRTAVLKDPAMQVRAREAKMARTVARRASTLRRDFLDANQWEEMASRRGVRLPPWGEPCATSAMESWLHRVGWGVREYTDWSGLRKLDEFITRNPTWPLRAFAALLLEATGDA